MKREGTIQRQLSRKVGELGKSTSSLEKLAPSRKHHSGNHGEGRGEGEHGWQNFGRETKPGKSTDQAGGSRAEKKKKIVLAKQSPLEWEERAPEHTGKTERATCLETLTLLSSSCPSEPSGRSCGPGESTDWRVLGQVRPDHEGRDMGDEVGRRRRKLE